MDQVKRICILGGGTAGWMTAAALSNKFKGLGFEITLIESNEIGTVGVGEATLPHIRFFNSALGLDEKFVMKSTNATFKLGIEFCDWGKIGDSYIHPFGDYGLPMPDTEFHQLWLREKAERGAPRLDEYSYSVMAAEKGKFHFPGDDTTQIGSNFGYAYQFDSSLYAKLLRSYSENNHVRRIEGKVVETHLNAESGYVKSLSLENGAQIEADIFVDCSGFRGVLIEQALETGYEDWSRWLPCNRAYAVQSESRGELLPYTRATARKAGWQWRIPLQHRTGNGHVYCSDFISDEDALHQLMSTLEGPALTDPKKLFFKTGRRNAFWSKNVVAIGLSAGFLEPLESTSIHLIQEGITNLVELFPSGEIDEYDIREYNDRMELNFDRVRDFLLLHYVATQRDDSEMWRYFRNLELPESLTEKMEAWQKRGYVIPYEHGVFLPPSWISVMLGQNLEPKSFDQRVNKIPQEELSNLLRSIHTQTHQKIHQAPAHAAFLAEYVKGVHVAQDNAAGS
ncbi:MAG: tryptophan 7-halogenase [Henriciella sp.]|nr:tryptophan 7-halogenase [Henriciella sp.]